MVGLKPSDHARFYAKTARNAATGCLEWTAGVDGSGYGKFKIVGSPCRSAHRIAWVAHRGAIPAGMFVCHRCDNRLCVEISHLWLGSCADNAADMVNKGRQCRGVRSPHAKLTEAHVRAIHADDRFQLVIAADYGVTTGQVNSIKVGRTWRHLGLPVIRRGSGRRPRTFVSCTNAAFG